MKHFCLILLVLSLLFTSCSTLDKGERTIMVSGRAEIEVQPDMATFSLSVTERADTTKEAQESVNIKISKVIDILMSEYNIDRNDIKTTYMNISPEYSWQDGKQNLVGQKANQSVEITIRDISILSAIFDSITRVSGISISNISLDSTQRESYLSQARKEAVENARERANDYAASQGLKSGDVINITEKSFDSASVRIGNAVMAKAVMMDESVSTSTEYYFSLVKVSSDVDAVFELIK